MDTSSLQNLLQRLRSSSAFNAVAGNAPAEPQNDTPYPVAETQASASSDMTQEGLLAESSTVSGRIASLLSQLTGSKPAASEPEVTATSTAEEESFPELETRDDEAFVVETILGEAPTTDLRSMGYVQSLSRIEALLKSPTAASIIMKLQDDQRDLEETLWSARQTIISNHEKKLQSAIGQAKFSTGGDELDGRQSQQAADSLKLALRNFDRERVFPAWDNLVKRQQETLENLGVPSMFVTDNTADRSRQQRLVRVIEEGLADA